MTVSMFTAFNSSPKENPDQVNFDDVADNNFNIKNQFIFL